MTVDVAVVGAPFLDITFQGLRRVPQIGEEVLARALHVAPGGTGMQAIGAARLGLTTVLVAPIHHEGAAGIVGSVLEAEGVEIVSGDRSLPDSSGGLPTTALLSTSEGVAMATVLAGREPSPEDVSRAGASSVVLSLGRLSLAPPGARIYAVTGGLEIDRVDDAVLRCLTSARALIVNAAEASALTGDSDPAAAARALARSVPTVVVTTGADGALAARGQTLLHAPAPVVDVVDATGAGDLFTAAYVWAESGGAPLPDCIAWAALYAGLSVRAPTAYAGALGLDALLNEGAARGLDPPPTLRGR